MAVERAHVGWGFWLRWLLATIAGWTVGLVILILLPKTSVPTLVEGIFLMLAGTLTSVAQWLVLRRHIRQVGRWVPASVVGWIGGYALFLLLAMLGVWTGMSTATAGVVFKVSFGAIAGAGVGAATGFLQWLILRRQIKHTGWWVMVNVAAWGCGLMVLVLASSVARAAFLGIGVLVGVVVGGVTGTALVLLWKSPPLAFVSLRVRLMLAFSLLAVMVLWGSSYWIYDYAVNTALDDTTEEIKTLLRVAAAGVDGDETVALYQVSDLDGDARYQNQLRWLEMVQGETPYALYTFVRADEPGKIAFVVDTLALDDPASAARFREAWSPADDSLMWQGFTTTTVSTVENFSLSALFSEITWQGLVDEPAGADTLQDGREAWISGYAPIQNALGESVAVIGIDLPVAHTSEIHVDVFTPVRRVFGELFIPMLIVVFLISRAITRPLVAVTKAARRIGEGDYDLDLSAIHRVRLRNEISELAEAIEESARAHISERNLRQKVEELKIQINEVKRRQQVEAIVEDEFFQGLQAKADEIRARRRGKQTPDDQET